MCVFFDSIFMTAVCDDQDPFRKRIWAKKNDDESRWAGHKPHWRLSKVHGTLPEQLSQNPWSRTWVNAYLVLMRSSGWVGFRWHWPYRPWYVASRQVTAEANLDTIHAVDGSQQAYHKDLFCRSLSGLHTVLTGTREVTWMRNMNEAWCSKAGNSDQ